MVRVGLVQAEQGERRPQEVEDVAFWCISFWRAFAAPRSN